MSYKGTNDKIRSKHLFTHFGISLEDYNNLLFQQEGCCMICGKHQSELSRSLGVDHNHSTGQIRGLLCTHCNSLVGCYEKNPDILRKITKYIRRYK